MNIISMHLIEGINKRIQEIDKLKRKAELQILSLNVSRDSLRAERDTWHNTFISCMASDITSDIVVQGMFRGNIAETLQVDFKEETNQMTIIGGGAATAAHAVNGQISKLNNYIDKLEEDKSKLLATLSSMQP